MKVVNSIGDVNASSDKRINELRASLTEAGFYTPEDIEKIIKLEKQFDEECERIAAQCEEDNYPPHGSNYDLRCENARTYYDEQLSIINAKYDIKL